MACARSTDSPRFSPPVSRYIKTLTSKNLELMPSSKLLSVSIYELELFSAHKFNGDYLPTFAAFQVVAQKLSAFSQHGSVSSHWPTHPEDAWSRSRKMSPVNTFSIQPTPCNSNSQIYCASSMTANRKEKESPHNAMIQDSAEWTELCEHCAWILTQVHSNDCIAVYNDIMAQRQLLNHELQDMVRQVALHKAGKESTISHTPPCPRRRGGAKLPGLPRQKVLRAT
jgi:hypothetical protein